VPPGTRTGAGPGRRSGGPGWPGRRDGRARPASRSPPGRPRRR
jgi:hypothetical protein